MFNILSVKVGQERAYSEVVFVAQKYVSDTHAKDERTNQVLGDWSGYDLYPEDNDHSVFMNGLSEG